MESRPPKLSGRTTLGRTTLPRTGLQLALDIHALQCKARPMQSDRAREHLEVIRTLMERSAVYRRALAPMTLLAGGVGSLAALVGWNLDLASPRAFIGYWLGVAVLVGALALLLVRRQALQAHEPFWSPPARRVARAAAPALFAGLVLGLTAWLRTGAGPVNGPAALAAAGWLPCGWVILYGCAVHSAGFFMPRGIRLFGGLLILIGCGLLLIGPPTDAPAGYGWAVMGGVFGGLHLAYGIYLRFTEPREPAA